MLRGAGRNICVADCEVLGIFSFILSSLKVAQFENLGELVKIPIFVG